MQLSETNQEFLSRIQLVVDDEDPDLALEEDFDVASVHTDPGGKLHRPKVLPQTYQVSEISYRDQPFPFLGSSGYGEEDLKQQDGYMIHIPEIVDHIFQDTAHDIASFAINPLMREARGSNLNHMMSLPADVTNKLFGSEHVLARPYQLLVKDLLEDYPILDQCDDDPDENVKWMYPQVRLFLMLEQLHSHDPFYVTAKRNRTRFRETDKKVMSQLSLHVGVRRGGFPRIFDLASHSINPSSVPAGVSVFDVGGFHGTPT